MSELEVGFLVDVSPTQQGTDFPLTVHEAFSPSYRKNILLLVAVVVVVEIFFVPPKTV